MFGQIKWRLLLTYLTIILLTMMVFNVALVGYFNEYYIRGKASTLLVNANVFGSISSQAIVKKDPSVKFTAYDFALQTDMRILVLDDQGVVLGDSADQPDLVARPLNRPEVRTALTGKSEISVQTLPGKGLVMYVAVPVMVSKRVVGAIFVSSSLAEVEALLQQLKWRLLVVTLVSGMVGSIISYFIAGNIARRTVYLTRAARAMAEGRLDQRVKVTGQDELAELGRAFNRMAEQLAKLEETRRQFVADASHELRTPLSSIKVLVETLQDGAINDPVMAGEFLADLDQEIDRLNRIVADLLQLTLLDAPANGLLKEKVDLTLLLLRAIDLVKPAARRKGVTVEVGPSGPMVLSVDGEKMFQVFLNLIDNGIKFTPPGGRVEAGISELGSKIIIAVRDTGTGIPALDLPQIFERFYRVDKARARDTGGTGLGLAIARKIVTQHGGEILVDSTLGQGSEFRVILPK